MGDPNCARELARHGRDCETKGEHPPDPYAPNAAAYGQSAEINEADAGVGDPDAGVMPECVKAHGGSQQFRAAGIATEEELEAYLEECADKMHVQYGEDVVLMAELLWDAGGVVVDVAAEAVEAAGESVKDGFIAGKRIYRTLTADGQEMMQIGSENLELIEFATEVISSGLDFAKWVIEPAGPVAQMVMMYAERFLETEIAARNLDALKSALADKLDDAVPDLAKAVAVTLVAGSMFKRLLLASLQVVQTQSLKAGMGALLTPPAVHFALYLALILSLKSLALCEKVAAPRRRLQAEHPQIFAFAEEHKCAFMWTWIEPLLPLLEAHLDERLQTLAGDR